MVWKRKKNEGWKTMGILGAGHGCGATHLSVWISNWLTGIYHEKTAVLEWNDHGDFGKMLKFCQTGADDRMCGQILDVDYYPEAGAGELAFCIRQLYERILIDYGECTEERLDEWIRCDRRVLVGSFSEWQSGRFLELLRRFEKLRQEWTAVVVFGSEETRRAAEKEMHRRILRVPYSVDAYTVTRSDMNFLKKLCMDLSR
jgi:hypothetical protein